MLGSQKYQHDDSLGSCTSIHYISTLFPPIYDMRWLIDGKFRGFAAKVDDFMSIAMFRGGQCQNQRGADSKYQYWYWTTINHTYSMGRASNDGPWYNRATSMLMKGPFTGGESNGGKSIWKFDDFVANLGGRRPPRRVRAYISTNNHELNNTLTVPPQGMYLVRL